MSARAATVATERREAALQSGRTMFAGMKVMTVADPTTFPCRLGSDPCSGGGPQGQQSFGRDSIVTGVNSCKKKLSKRPGYMRKDVKETFSHPTATDRHLVSQNIGKETKTCANLSFDINKQEKYKLNKHPRENRITKYQNSYSDHLPVRCPLVAPMTVSENVHCSLNSNCQERSFYTGIPNYSKHLLTGNLQKEACLRQCKKEKNIDISKAQAVASPNKQLNGEHLQRQLPWDVDKEIDSTDTFVSNFNFIQMSSDCKSTIVDNRGELQKNRFVLQFPIAEPEMRQYDANTLAINQFCPKSSWKDFETHCLYAWQNVGIKCDSDTKSENIPLDYDLLSLDTNTFLCSADSYDGSSAGSSVTSGYESNITVIDRKCYSLMRKYETILQDCLLENRMKLKHQTLILKLQKLQKAAVQDDDYEKADKFNKKLAELKSEPSSLKLQLPSYHPCILNFLQKFELQLQMTEHQNECIFKNWENFLLKSNEDKHSNSSTDNLQISWSRRSRLIQDRQQLQREIADMKERLALLEARDRQLSLEIEEGSRRIESCDCELISLPTASASELRDLQKMLEDVLPLRNKVILNAELPEDIKRLQRREHSLSIALKRAAAKVCSSQKLCSNLSKRVSNIEAQLPTLLEAKTVAITGCEYSTAKVCAEEIKSLTSDKTKLEEIINDLQSLIISNGQQLEAIKEDYCRLKTELEQEERLFENNQRENIIKYMGILEDKLHSYGTHLFEKVWEADLETCQLLIRGLHLKESSNHAWEEEEYQTGEEDEATEGDIFPSKQDWNSVHCFVSKQKETDSQVSVKCLLNIESSQLKVACKGSAVDLGEQCEDISIRLACLEEQLQVAVNNHDDTLNHYLQREIQMVKEALQAILKQLLSLEEETTEDFIVNIW